MQTAEGEASDAPASPLPPPTVDFEADGEGWEVEVAGRTLSGTRPDSGAPLLLLRFRQAKGAGETPPVREAWAVARSLFDLSPIELAELLSRSRVRGPDRDASGGEEGRRRGRRKAR